MGFKFTPGLGAYSLSDVHGIIYQTHNISLDAVYINVFTFALDFVVVFIGTWRKVHKDNMRIIGPPHISMYLWWLNEPKVSLLFGG